MPPIPRGPTRCRPSPRPPSSGAGGAGGFGGAQGAVWGGRPAAGGGGRGAGEGGRGVGLGRVLRTCIIEPMQSEGGDRYATARFFKALRLLATRHHGVPLIFDEVQTGFGLGGTLFLARALRARGLGGQARLSRRGDGRQAGAGRGGLEPLGRGPEPTTSHAASLVRGLIHAQMMARTRRTRPRWRPRCGPGSRRWRRGSQGW